MSANQLPENMGKKIVEALKRQALMEDENTSNQFVIKEENNNFEQNYNVEEEPVIKETECDMEYTSPVQQNYQEYKETPVQFSIPNNPVQNNNNIMYNSYSPELPTNVAVLKKLILQLPAGVSKQVGAQIIRQTIEALGISMNSVLQEAQQVQENLNNSISECTVKIQEYKNQIMQLESNAREYQRQMAQINDLISLFILTDNK